MLLINSAFHSTIKVDIVHNLADTAVSCKASNLFYSLTVTLLCSPVNPVTNVFPLTVVLAVSLVKEAIEDAKRRQKDSQVSAVQDVSLNQKQATNNIRSRLDQKSLTK